MGSIQEKKRSLWLFPQGKKHDSSMAPERRTNVGFWEGTRRARRFKREGAFHFRK